MYISLNNPERRQLEEAMHVVRGNNGRVRDYLTARLTALEIARDFYSKSPEAKREMSEVYREIGNITLEKGEPGFWRRLFNLPF